jgi:hypothetical protein
MSASNTPQSRINSVHGRKSYAQSPKSHKTRDQELEEEIKKIWKEVNEDVDWLSQPLPDKKKGRFKRLFHGGSSGKGKEDPKSPRKSEKDNIQDDETDPTTKILGMALEVMPKLTSDEGTHYKTLEKTVTNTIKCINTLGERVAGAASLVSSSNFSKAYPVSRKQRIFNLILLT